MDETRIKLMEAVARRRTVSIRYNGAELHLAPHMIFERHGDLFFSALNLGKEWRSPEERSLGQFKLAGVSETQVLEDGFEPLPTFDGQPPRADDTVILAI